jgi:hypothetical protein
MRRVRIVVGCVLLALSTAACVVQTEQGTFDCIVTIKQNMPTTECTPVQNAAAPR